MIEYSNPLYILAKNRNQKMRYGNGDKLNRFGKGI